MISVFSNILEEAAITLIRNDRKVRFTICDRKAFDRKCGRVNRSLNHAEKFKIMILSCWKRDARKKDSKSCPSDSLGKGGFF